MIFSIDVEDWSQSVLNRNNPVSDRVYANTMKVLDILSENHQKATFFTLVNVAKKFPMLIHRMVEEGHEVASHGYQHHNIDLMTNAQIHQEIESSVKALEDISAEKVLGFRAPNFSINETVLEPFCEALASQELRYDSSLFSIPVRKYNITKKYPLDAFKKFGIDEHYLTHIKIAGQNFPFFGGGYFRLFPYRMTKHFSYQYDKNAVFYMHPYEVDTEELAVLKTQYNDIPTKWLMTQFVRRGAVPTKLRKLLADFNFSSFKDTYYRT
jgi:polysaccharide deacetylase family protein (PEP-CTERM system associated)